MIVVDANLLVYAFSRDLSQHEASRDWLDRQLSGSVKVGLPWPSLLAFVRLVSNPRVFERPVGVPQAWQQVEEWLDAERAWIPLPTPQHRLILGRLLEHVGRANLVPDADLAALAIEHGLTLCSTDRDFAQFPDLRWFDPLAA